MLHTTRFASSLFLAAAFALQACGGAVSSPEPGHGPDPMSTTTPAQPGPTKPANAYPSPQALRGDETITIESGLPGNAVPSCSDGGSVVLDTRIVLKLDTGNAAQTVTTATCAPGQNVVVGAVTRSSSSSSLTVTQAQLAPILKSLRSLSPARDQPCGFDGDANQLTIAYDDGSSDIFADTEGPGQCAPATGMIGYEDMTNLFTLANALF